MSRKSLAIRGVLFNWIGRGCAFAIAIFLTPYLVNTLGDERYGVWSLLMSMTAYYGLADLGLRSAATKYISQFEAEGDYVSVNRVINTSLAIYACLSTLVIVVAACIGPFFTTFFETDAVTASRGQLLVLVTAATVAMRLTVQVFEGSIISAQQHGFRNAIAVVAQLLNAIGVVLALKAGYGLIGMAWVTLVIAVVTHLTTMLFAWKLLPQMRISPKYFHRDTLGLVFRFGGVTSLADIARRLSEQFAIIVIGTVFGPAMVTYYSIPDTILRKLGTLSRGLNTAFFPAVSVLNAKGDYDQLRSVLIELLRGCLTVGVALGCVFVFMGRDVIGIWINPEYVSESYPVMLILSVSFICQMFASPAKTYLRGAAQLRGIASVAVAEGVLTVLLGIVGAYLGGLRGVAASVAVTQFFTCVICMPWLVAQALDIKFSRLWKEILLPVLPACVPVILFAFGMSRWFHPTRMLHLIPMVGSVMAVAGVGILFFCFGTERRDDIITAFLGKRKRPRKVGAIET